MPDRPRVLAYMDSGVHGSGILSIHSLRHATYKDLVVTFISSSSGDGIPLMGQCIGLQGDTVAVRDCLSLL